MQPAWRGHVGLITGDGIDKQLGDKANAVGGKGKRKTKSVVQQRPKKSSRGDRATPCARQPGTKNRQQTVGEDKRINNGWVERGSLTDKVLDKKNGTGPRCANYEATINAGWEKHVGLPGKRL